MIQTKLAMIRTQFLPKDNTARLDGETNVLPLINFFQPQQGGAAMTREHQKKLDRRNFLRGAGASVLSLAAIGSTGLFLNKSVGAAQSSSAPTWKYVKLDPDLAGKRAYENYFEGG